MLDFGPRFYDATVGRFFAPDPILAEPSAYSFAAGNPIMLYDPSGMVSISTRDWLVMGGNGALESVLEAEMNSADSYVNPDGGIYMVDGDIQVNGPYVSYEDLPSGSAAYANHRNQERINEDREEYCRKRQEAKDLSDELQVKALLGQIQRLLEEAMDDESGVIASADGLDCLKSVEIDGKEYLFDEHIADNVAGFIEEAHSMGFDITIDEEGDFRTTAEQIGMRARYGSGAAKPGTSRHESGFAFDIEGDPPLSVMKACDPECYGTLVDLACEWGFDKISTEAWHFQAVPTAFGYNSSSAAIRHNQSDYQRRWRSQGF